MVPTNRRDEAATMEKFFVFDFQDFRLKIPRPRLHHAREKRKFGTESEFFGHPDIQKDLQGHPAVDGVPQGRDDVDSPRLEHFRLRHAVVDATANSTPSCLEPCDEDRASTPKLRST